MLTVTQVVSSKAETLTIVLLLHVMPYSVVKDGGSMQGAGLTSLQ